MSDSESDPFSVAGSARFRPGKTEVQFGRKHRLVRPRFDLASMAGVMELRRPIVVGLKLWLDEKGNVTRVVVARSSGSPEVDQPVKVAAYEWWLEPTKDPRTGKPIPDVIGFVVKLD
jgi:TonB family protein